MFVLVHIFLRESRPFLRARIAYLEVPPECRAEEKKNAAKAQGSVVAGFKLIIKNKQLRWLAIVATGMLFKVMPAATACVILAVPFLALGCLAVAFKTKETAGRSFEDIESDFAA